MRISYKKYTYILFLIFVITDIFIIFDIPFLRQIFGFFYLTIIPGMLIIRFFKLDKLSFIEYLALVWGLGIFFVIFIGLSYNYILLILGFRTPLSTTLLLVLFNFTSILLASIGYFYNKNTYVNIPSITFTVAEKLFLIIPLLLPGISAYGIYLMNKYNENVLILLLFVLISSILISLFVFRKYISERLNPFLIFLISFALLLLLPLRSNHIIGIDSHYEFYYFATTLDNLYWRPLGYSPLDACLSISLLPTIYYSVLNISPEMLYRLLYSMLYSISPLVIYTIARKYMSESFSFLAACFYIFQKNFLWTEYNARANIAMLFFALFVFVYSTDKINLIYKRILLLIFIASCTVSHYSTTYIFLFVLSTSFLIAKLLPNRYNINTPINLSTILVFSTFIFLWYSYLTDKAFYQGIRFLNKTLISLSAFFVGESRSESVYGLFGQGIIEKGIPHKLEFILTWSIFIFIAIGVLMILIKYDEMIVSEFPCRKLWFLVDKFDASFLTLTLACAGLLLAVIAIPYISIGYGLDRMYPLAITSLSLFFVIGVILIVSYLAKLKSQRKTNRSCSVVRITNISYSVVLLMIISYFMCINGSIYYLFNYNNSIIIDACGQSYDKFYIHDQEFYAGTWLGNTVPSRDIEILTDQIGANELISYGKLPFNIDRYSFFDPLARTKGYIYLRYYNIINGKVLDRYGVEHPLSSYTDKFSSKNNIYMNGGAGIWI